MSDKYMKEIEEILKRAEEVMPQDRTGAQKNESRASGGSPSLLRRLSRGRGLKISAGKLMLGSLGLLLLALIMSVIVGGGIVVPLVVAGLVLFVVAYALFFVRSGSSSYHEKRWRGRVIEDSPPIWHRFKRWLRG